MCDSHACPLLKTRTKLVFGAGNANADLMFVGEAPGATEDKTGLPFVGRAGQLLTDMITKGMGLTREEVYIANILKSRPPENRNPLPDEVANCLPFLERQIAIVRPGRKPLFVRGGWGYGSWQPWSPDGRVLLVSSRGELHAFSPQGRALWHVFAYVPSGTWSPQGLFAVTVQHGAAVYDEQGHLHFKVRFDPSLSNSGPVWSPDGRNLLLSAASGFDFEVSTSTGATLLRKHVRYGLLGWAGSNRLAKTISSPRRANHLSARSRSSREIST